MPADALLFIINATMPILFFKFIYDYTLTQRLRALNTEREG
jgi:hypothetical protein